MAVRTLRVTCASWDQVEAFYLRKLRRGRSVTVRVPFTPEVGEPITVGLELPNELVIAIDGAITEVAPGGDDRTAITIDLRGLTADLLDRLEQLVLDGRAAARGEVDPAPGDRADYDTDVARRTDDPAHERVVELEAALRRLRQLAVHEVLGVPWDASALEVRAAWRALCHRFHPDALAAHGSAAVAHLAEELMILVNRAYDRMRGALVAEGRAAALGPALRPEKGWLVAFDSIGTGDVAPPPRPPVRRPSPPTELPPLPPPPPDARRKKPTTAVPTVRFGPTTEQALGDIDVPASGSVAGSLAAARAAGTDDKFEQQARARLAVGDHRAAREILAAALYVYPRNQALRALYHVTAAHEALDAGQAEHATSQLEAALSADPGCREARVALDELRRREERRS